MPKKRKVEEQKDKVFAVTALVCGLLFWIPLFNLLLGPLAIIFGILSIKRVRADPQRYGGQVMAVIGLVLGVISVIFTVVGLYVSIMYPQLSYNSTSISSIVLPWNIK